MMGNIQFDIGTRVVFVKDHFNDDSVAIHKGATGSVIRQDGFLCIVRLDDSAYSIAVSPLSLRSLRHREEHHRAKSRAVASFIKNLPPEECVNRQEWLAEVARMHPSQFVRRSSMVALRRISSSLVRPISLLIIAHENKNQNLRETAIKCLGEVGTEDDLALLKDLKQNEKIARFGRLAASKAYVRLSKRFGLHRALPHLKRAKDHTPFFDVAFSFAGEDRNIAEELAIGLRAKSLKVFYDMFYKEELLGEDLSRLLGKIYRQASRFCVVLLSKYYPQKSWTRFELSQAQDKAISSRKAYIIPIRLDSTHVDGISSTTGYIDLREHSISYAIDVITKKVNKAITGEKPLSDVL
ncbi:MAG: TIR domain-containing protein [Planctomycetes bacterium]|nr:TIR domain-containing protein [Planctomycetota bacterium]